MEAFAVVYVFHSHYLFGNKFIFYVDHLALLYLVRTPSFKYNN